MANSINATSTGNGGIITTGDDSGVLNIQTNETTAISIDASQNATFTNGANLPNTFGFKNRLINGAMQIWQRGTSQSSFGYGSVDRWLLNSSNSTLARSTDVPSGFSYSALLTGTSALNAQITQRIESANCFDLVGQSVTISFWVKSASGTSNFIVYVNYADSADNFATTTYIGQTTVTSPTSTWTKYSFTLNNLAAGVANGLQIGMYRAGTDTSTTYITGVQLEKGTQATSFDFRSIGTELALCQRYGVALVSGVGIVATGQAYSTSVAGAALRFPVTMRASPTVTISSAAHFVGTDAPGNQAAFGGTNFGSITPNAFSFELTARTGAGLVSGNACSIFASTSSATLFASAEL